MKKSILLILVAALGLTLGACSDENSEIPPTKLHPLAWSDPLNFTGADFHSAGLIDFDVDVAPCAECHGLDLLGSSTVPGCNACHDDIRGGHLPGIQDPAVHGPLALADFQLCKMCHGDDYLGGITGFSCAPCHQAANFPWPHPASSVWLDSGNAGYHGTAADTALERTDCAICHGSDFRGGTTGVSCFTCHFDETGARYPNGLTHHNNHPSMTAFVTTCNNCHNTNRAFGNSPGACHDCHGDGD